MFSEISKFIIENDRIEQPKHKLWKFLNTLLDIIYASRQIDINYDLIELYYYSFPYMKKCHLYIILILYGDFAFRIDDLIEKNPKGSIGF